MISEEQAITLATLEQAHGKVLRIPDESEIGEELLSQCVSYTIAYQCVNCSMAFTIEPDGATSMWALIAGES